MLVTALSAAAVVGGLAWVRRNLILVTVSGLSMAPTLRDGDRVLVLRRAAPRLTVGDVVVLAPPEDPDSGLLRGFGHHLKRVVALPGDPMPAGIAGGVPGPGGDRVPPEHLIVLSDNPIGIDSRNWGPYPAGGVIGVAVAPRRVRTPSG